MSLYECVFIARQDIAPPQVETLTDEFAAIITAGGGNVAKREYWGLRNIAYRMRKNRKGHYMLLNIDAPSAAIKEMERQMGINENILRVLTVRVDELEEGPSAMMQSRQRDDRPRRDGDDRPRREGGFGGRDGGFGGRDGGFGRDGGGYGRGPRAEGGEA